MYLESLHIKDLLSHRDSFFSFDRLTVIRGLNGKGKTSVQQAIELLLAGRSIDTDAGGGGMKDLIRRGESQAVITGEIFPDDDQQDATKLRATIREKGREVKAKKESDPNYTGKDWIEYLSSKKDILSCLINGRHFMNMPAAAQKKLLTGIVLPSSVIWDDWVEEACQKASIPVDWSLPPFELIALAHQVCYDARTDVNRSLKEWKNPEKPAPVNITTEEVKARLKERQDERDKLVTKRAVARGSYDHAVAASEKEKAKVSSLTEKLETERKRVNETSDLILNHKKLTEYEKIAANHKLAAELDAETTAIGALLAEKRGRISKLMNLKFGTCPTCSQDITRDAIDMILEPMKKDAEAADALYNAKMHERKELGDIAGAQKAIAEHKQAEKDLQLIYSHVSRYEKELKEAEAAVQVAQEPLDTAEIDKQISDLDERITKGTAALQMVSKHDADLKAYNDSVNWKAGLDQRLGHLQKLIDYFGPNGPTSIQSKLLDEHIGGFESSMNKILAKWGFQCKLSFEPYCFGVEIQAGSGQWFNVQHLSESQRYRFACAFQIALAEVSGFRFCVIDGADILDNSDGRKGLYSALLTETAQLDQIIVMQTDANKETPKAPKTAFYMLDSQVIEGIPTTAVERLS